MPLGLCCFFPSSPNPRTSVVAVGRGVDRGCCVSSPWPMWAPCHTGGVSGCTGRTRLGQDTVISLKKAAKFSRHYRRKERRWIWDWEGVRGRPVGGAVCGPPASALCCTRTVTWSRPPLRRQPPAPSRHLEQAEALPTGLSQARGSWDLSLGLRDTAAGQPCTTLPTRGIQTCSLLKVAKELLSFCAPHMPSWGIPSPLSLSLTHLPDPSPLPPQLLPRCPKCS